MSYDVDKLIKMACLSLMFMNIGTHINLRTFIKKITCVNVIIRVAGKSYVSSSFLYIIFMTLRNSNISKGKNMSRAEIEMLCNNGSMTCKK